MSKIKTEVYFNKDYKLETYVLDDEEWFTGLSLYELLVPLLPYTMWIESLDIERLTELGLYRFVQITPKDRVNMFRFGAVLMVAIQSNASKDIYEFIENIKLN
jgi:hypothetical protein